MVLVRLLALAAIAVLLYVLARHVVLAVIQGLRGASRPADGRRALMDELVKDPVCQTYVPRRSAVRQTSGAVTRYFCSPACAEKFRDSG